MLGIGALSGVLGSIAVEAFSFIKDIIKTKQENKTRIEIAKNLSTEELKRYEVELEKTKAEERISDNEVHKESLKAFKPKNGIVEIANSLVRPFCTLSMYIIFLIMVCREIFLQIQIPYSIIIGTFLLLLETSLGFYFGSRSIQKYKKCLLTNK